MEHPEAQSQRVGPEQAGLRLDRLLQEWGPSHSRTYWQRQILQGRIQVNGRAARASYTVQGGDAVSITQAPAAPVPAAWNTGALVDGEWVVYQDKDLVVVNKPRNLVVHPSHGHEDDSVVHRLAPWLAVESEDFRPGVVHRLDRDTTGLLVLARSETVRTRLSDMIQDREVHRDYLAVVTGRLPEPAGVIDAPIGRDPGNRLKMAVVYSGRHARTHYRTLAAWDKVSLVQLTLETGRTHQIRVHLASAGHPVQGDPLYARAGSPFKAQLLHAARLSFRHPVSGEPLCFWQMPPAEDWTSWAGQSGPVTVVDPVALASTELCGQVDTGFLLAKGLGLLGQ